jgi:hypothetical protein
MVGLNWPGLTTLHLDQLCGENAARQLANVLRANTNLTRLELPKVGL